MKITANCRVGKRAEMLSHSTVDEHFSPKSTCRVITTELLGNSFNEILSVATAFAESVISY